MFTHLHYKPYDGGTPRLISGKTLLFLLERSCRETVNRSVNGSGTGAADDPWRLTQPGHWLTCASVLTTAHPRDAYLTLGGRMIKKNARVYVSDEGPVYRYIVDAHRAEVTPEASKTYGGVAPTYQAAAQRIMRPHTVFPTTAQQVGFVRDAWTDVGKTKMLVNAMRNLLRGESVGLVSTHYSRMQASLPVLVAAMFLAEPGRNIRAFPLNLMLLDLAEAGTPLDPIARTTYTMDRILWHPEALDISQDTDSAEARSAPTTPVRGPASAEDRTMGPVEQRNKLHLVGGEMPSSPTMGGEKGGVKLAVKTPPVYGPEVRDIPSTRRNWLRGQLRFQNFDYIHMKEIDVLTRWIARRRPHTFAAVEQTAFVGGTVEVPDWDVLFYGNDQTATDLRDLANAIARRLQDFDAL